MPGLTNELTHHGIIDQQQLAQPQRLNGTSNLSSGNSGGPAASTASADVYIIPDYAASTAASRHHPQHLLGTFHWPHPSYQGGHYGYQ